MTILRMVPLLLACAISIPLSAQTASSSSRDNAIYYPPESMGKNLSISSSTNNTTTFRFLVKSLIGTSKNVKLTAKVIGQEGITPVPSTAEFQLLSERKNATLDFIIPVSKEQINQQKIKIQCNVEYLPDYQEIIKHIEAESKSKYQNEAERNHLLDLLKKNQQNSLKSNQAIRYIPEKK